MKISEAEVMHIRLPFRFAFRHNLAKRNYSENIIVRVVVESEGKQFVGFGEGIPRDYVTGETAQGSIATIKSEFLPQLIGRHFRSQTEVVADLQSLFEQLRLSTRTLGAAWCAVELAIFDAFGKAFNLPAANFIGNIYEPCQRNGMLYGGVIPFCNNSAFIAVLWFYKLYGFTTVKIKVGTELSKDLERLRLARKILGDNVKLRVDANGAWSADEAILAAKRMRPLGVLSLEQPTPADDLESLAQVTASVSEEVVADESLCTIAQAQFLADENICSAFNIRLSKVGGLLAASRIAKIAAQKGLGLHLGAQVGESGILSAAGRAFAATRSDLKNCEGSNNFFLLKKDITRENLNVGVAGIGNLLPGPGLGINIVPAKLQAVCQFEREIERDGHFLTDIG